MPITVVCHACSARLNVSANAEGKHVTCPKCAAAITVPAPDFDVVNEPVMAKKATRRIVRDDLDDDDDDDFERARKRRKKPAKQKTNAALYVGGGIALVLLVVCGGIGAVGYTVKKKLDDATNPAKVQWVPFDSAEGGFTASFPGERPTEGDFFAITGGKAGNFHSEREDLRKGGIRNRSFVVAEFNRRYGIAYMIFPANGAAAASVTVNAMNTEMKVGSIDDGERVVSAEDTTIAGLPARKVIVEAMDRSGQKQMMIFFASGSRVYLLTVDAIDLKPDDAMAAAFFGKFALKPSGGFTPPRR